jgi:hypothetical protein
MTKTVYAAKHRSTDNTRREATEYAPRHLAS